MGDEHQPPGTQRLFFALKVPANLAGPIREAQRKLRGNWRNVNADQMHVTLAYLPAVPNERVDELKRLGVQLMQDLAPMQVHLRGTGYHPNEGSPRVWFVKVEAEGLPELAQALRDGIHELGLRTDDQPFKGHITLARKKGPAPRVPPLIFTQNWQAGGAVLYRSILRKTGPLYETASTFRFRAPPTEPTTQSISTEPIPTGPSTPGASTPGASTAPTTTSPAPQAAPDNQ
nr:RNA 2',3'-cyclic phosphodiesterase [Deinococcus sp.]